MSESMSGDLLRRMQADDMRLRQTETKEVPLPGSGTAFPSSPAAGWRFFRTDLGFLCYFDGARWLTVQEYPTVIPPYGRTAQPYAGAAGVLLLAPMRTDRGLVVTRAKAYLDVVAPNTGANFWSLALKESAGGSSIWTFTTAADAPGVGLNKEFFTPTVVVAANYYTFEVTGKTGAPGTIVLSGGFWYRLIIT